MGCSLALDLGGKAKPVSVACKDTRPSPPLVVVNNNINNDALVWCGAARFSFASRCAFTDCAYVGAAWGKANAVTLGSLEAGHALIQ